MFSKGAIAAAVALGVSVFGPTAATLGQTPAATPQAATLPGIEQAQIGPDLWIGQLTPVLYTSGAGPEPGSQDEFLAGPGFAQYVVDVGIGNHTILAAWYQPMDNNSQLEAIHRIDVAPYKDNPSHLLLTAATTEGETGRVRIKITIVYR